MKASELINWVALSKELAGNRESIRRNHIPAKYSEKVKELLLAIEKVFKK